MYILNWCSQIQSTLPVHLAYITKFSCTTVSYLVNSGFFFYAGWCVTKMKNRWSWPCRYQCGFLSIFLCQNFPTISFMFSPQELTTQSMQCISFVVKNTQYATVTWSLDIVSWVNWISISSKINPIEQNIENI